ncbi:helix-turn-helix domain-containing protein [Streptomyces sp. NPDC037389]|uniref:IclR family transcriptional regulator n=1 Tax=Streptomyces sp. NPDC037389 TaxID=3155369 RepID=UPI0033F41E28
MGRTAAGGTGERPTPGRGVLEGAFALLEALGQAREAGLTALSADSGLPKTTAYRLLEQLVDLGVVEHHGSRYRMGSRMFRLGLGWQPPPGLCAAARVPARRLAEATGASVGICVLREGRTLAVQGVPGVVDHLAPLRPGATWPWYAAAGKVLVAAASPRVPLDPLPASWRREAAVIRDGGVAVDREELVPGVCCVAVPLTAPGGEVVAGLCAMVDPAHDLGRLTRAVARTGRAVGAALRGPALGRAS